MKDGWYLFERAYQSSTPHHAHYTMNNVALCDARFSIERNPVLTSPRYKHLCKSCLNKLRKGRKILKSKSVGAYSDKPRISKRSVRD